jgi:acetyl-CoA synthetase
MSLLSAFCPKTVFDSYDSFAAGFSIQVPDNFNFAYDVVDRIAATEPDRRALVWCNDAGEERVFSFSDLQERKLPGCIVSEGQGHSSRGSVMVMLKARYEFWFYILALHRLGAICIPATHMLTTHDLCTYKAPISRPSSRLPTTSFRALLMRRRWKPAVSSTEDQCRSHPEGWSSYNDEIDAHIADFPRPAELTHPQ